MNWSFTQNIFHTPDKTTLITLLAVFTALITFLLGDIQILKTVIGDFQLIGFSLILLSSLLFFVIAIDYIARGWIDPELKPPLKWELLIIISFLFILGMFLSWKGNPNPVKLNAQKIQDMEKEIKILSGKVDNLQTQRN